MAARRVRAWVTSIVVGVGATATIGLVGIRAQPDGPSDPVEAVADGEGSATVITAVPGGEAEGPTLRNMRGSLVAGLRGRLASSTPKILGVMTERGLPEEIDRFSSDVGRRPDTVSVAISWVGGGYDTSLLDEVARRGAIPILGWEPWDHTLGGDEWVQPDYSLDRIADGAFDDYVDLWARGLASLDYPVMLRFGHEMNGFWYPWAAAANGNNGAGFVRAWRHLHDRFEAVGADNVLWVWSPNVIVEEWTVPLADVWPGDDYVDVAGVNGYFTHLVATPTAYPRYEELFGPTLDAIRGLTDKPILITEVAGTELGGVKPAWIEDFVAGVVDDDRVAGFVWFDVDKEDDWRVRSSPAAVSAFRDAIRHPAFGSS